MATIFSTTFDDTNFPTVRAVGRHWDQTIDGLADSVVGQTGDGIEGYAGWTISPSGQGDQILTAANFSSGGGGKGYRHWAGAGVNNGGGSLLITFPSRTEIWIRYYVRYQSGFAWASSDFYNKQLYWGTNTSALLFFGPIGFGEIVWHVHSDGLDRPLPGGGGTSAVGNLYANPRYTWNTWNGGSTGDGTFHCVELHLKRNTGSSQNGVFEMKLDGVLRLSYSNVLFTTSSENFSLFRMGENHQPVASGADQYIDFDDIAISDSDWVGQIGGDVTAPVLSSANAGTPTGDGTTGASVSTANDANGTLYWAVVTNGGSCTDAQLKAGSGGNIVSVAGAHNNQAVTATGTQTIIDITGLASSTAYQIKFLHRDAAGNDSAQASVNLTTSTPGDTTPPVLSSANAGVATTQGCTGAKVSTANDANGTLYWAIVTDGGSCTDAQLKAGSGGNIVLNKSNNQPVTLTGVQTIPNITGLVANTNYDLKFLHRDAAGNDSSQASVHLLTLTWPPLQTILFYEGFEDSNAGMTSRGWFDGTEGVIDNSVFSPLGGAGSLKFHWQLGNTNADPQTGARRHTILIDGTKNVFVEFDIKLGTSSIPWQGSGEVLAHPHIFYVLSDADNPQGALAANALNFYIEAGDVSGGNARPRILIQDNLRVNTSLLDVNLLGTATTHAVAGWNGHQDQATPTLVDTYGGGANNYTDWDGPIRSLLNNTWHRMRVFAQMNNISGGLPQADGIFKVWVDGVLQFQRTNVYFRTAQYPQQGFETLVLSPFIGQTSPIAQDLWIDNLTVADNEIVITMERGSKSLR